MLPTTRALALIAFVEGAAGLVLEIAGARVLAPYFGTTHVVWTAQITATLAFLALGYGLGGALAPRRSAGALVLLLAAAGIWLGLGSWLRPPLFGAMSRLGLA